MGVSFPHLVYIVSCKRNSKTTKLSWKRVQIRKKNKMRTDIKLNNLILKYINQEKNNQANKLEWIHPGVLFQLFLVQVCGSYLE